MGSEMNHGAESQRWHDHAPIRQMTGGTGLGKKVERLLAIMVRMSKGETRPLTERSNPLAPEQPGLCAALWGRGLDRVSGIAAMYSLKTIFIFFAQNFFFKE